MSKSLAGKIAFVTGAARGIGRAIALKLAEAGCDVAVAYHNNHEAAEAVCGSIRALGQRAEAIQMDVGDPEPRQVVAGIAEHYAPADLVGKQLVVVANLEPRKFGKFKLESFGMILAAHDGEGLAVVTPMRPVKAGGEVS